MNEFRNFNINEFTNMKLLNIKTTNLNFYIIIDDMIINKGVADHMTCYLFSNRLNVPRNFHIIDVSHLID